MVITISLTTGCGGGGSSSVALKGRLTDAFGAIINHSNAVVSLLGTGVTARPDDDGRFTLNAEPGKYTLNGILSDPSGGILLMSNMEVTLVKGQTLDVGLFTLTYGGLETGWDAYRKGQFNVAKNAFSSYLNDARSGQAHLGASSALSALGWTNGRGLNDPVLASQNFQEAVDGWSGNVDAMVGLSACEVSRMRSDGSFHFNQSVNVITQAIDAAGNYTSAPTHDQISEIDLYAWRSFINFINGNKLYARSEALGIQNQVTVEGNRASASAIAVVLEFTE